MCDLPNALDVRCILPLWSARSNIFNQPLGSGQVVCACPRCSPLKGAVVFEGPLILMMPVLGFYIKLDQLEDEATP